MPRYKCPLCGTPLTKARYEEVLRIQQERDRVAQAQIEGAHRRAREAKEAERQAKVALRRQAREGKARERDARDAGRKQGRAESHREATQLRKKLRAAEARARHLARGTTAQSEGLEFEEKLRDRLEKEFPGDDVTLVRKGGDVVHRVIIRKKPAGAIVYECKREEDLAPAHVRQAARAKRTRGAEFAILVTTGERKGFTGLAAERGVLIVRPEGVLALAALCRAHLVEMVKAGLDQARRAKIARELLAYLASPTYKTPVEEAIRESERAHELLEREVHQHFAQWLERSRIYQTIRWDVNHFRDNIARVREGEKPVPLEKMRVERLLLPKAAGAS